MGLDAFVRCTCFEEGRLNPTPIPKEDIYVDEDGYLASKMLDQAREQYDYRRFRARFGELEDEFEKWREHPCSHDDGEYCTEWVSNIAGCAKFRCQCEEIGTSKLPLLSNMLPYANEGSFSAARAHAALAELDVFEKELANIAEHVLLNKETEARLWSVTESSESIWICGPEGSIGLDENGIFVLNGANHVLFRSTRFSQEPTGNVRGNDTEMRLTDQVTHATCVIGCSLDGETDGPAEFIVEKHPIRTGTHVPTALRNLLRASIDTGNPIHWC